MRSFATSTITSTITSAIVAAALAAIALGFAGAAPAAPTGPPTASATIDKLQANGFKVIVERTGTGALDQCVVTSVRPGQTFSRTDTGSGQAGEATDLVTTVTAMTVYISLAC